MQRYENKTIVVKYGGRPWATRRSARLLRATSRF